MSVYPTKNVEFNRNDTCRILNFKKQLLRQFFFVEYTFLTDFIWLMARHYFQVLFNMLFQFLRAHFEFSEQGLHDVRCFAWGEAISMNSSEVLFREISQHCADAWESFESNREDIHPMFAKIWIFLTWFRGYNRLFDSNSVCALCGKLLHFGTFGFLPPAYLTFELPPEPLHAFW